MFTTKVCACAFLHGAPGDSAFASRVSGLEGPDGGRLLRRRAGRLAPVPRARSGERAERINEQLQNLRYQRNVVQEEAVEKRRAMEGRMRLASCRFTPQEMAGDNYWASKGIPNDRAGRTTESLEPRPGGRGRQEPRARSRCRGLFGERLFDEQVARSLRIISPRDAGPAPSVRATSWRHSFAGY